jgi:beta-lactamase regulating signal transducer with metallopeptidase domain
MRIGLDWVNSVSLAWWNYIVSGTWQAGIVGLGLLLIVHLFGRRWPAPLRYALLVLALLKFACPPLLPVPTGLFTHFSPPRVVLPSVQERKPTQASSRNSLKPTALVVATFNGRWATGLMMVHGLGTIAIGVVLFKQASHLQDLAKGARLLRGGRIPRQYRDLAIQFGLYRIPKLALSDKVAGPMAFGVKQPAIMLPPRMLGRLSLGELKAVLAHELAHCQRGDLWLNWIQLVLLALWWFHPVLWLINRSLREIREDCCDDLLLARRIISNDAYCDVLLRAAAETSPAFGLSPALGLRQLSHPLGRRLMRITDWSLKRAERVSLVGAAVVVVGAAILFPGTGSRENAPVTSSRLPVSLEPAVPQAAISVELVKSAPVLSSRVVTKLAPVSNNVHPRLTASREASPAQVSPSASHSTERPSARLTPVATPVPKLVAPPGYSTPAHIGATGMRSLPAPNPIPVRLAALHGWLQLPPPVAFRTVSWFGFPDVHARFWGGNVLATRSAPQP